MDTPADTSPAPPAPEEPGRCTEAEAEERVDYVKRLMRQALRRGIFHPSDFKAALKERYDLAHRQAMTYIRRALDDLVLEAEYVPEHELHVAVEYWTGIYTDSNQKPGRRDHARKQLDKIRGLQRIRVEHGGTIGVAMQGIDEVRQEILKDRDTLRAYREKDAGRPHTPDGNAGPVRADGERPAPPAVGDGPAPGAD